MNRASLVIQQQRLDVFLGKSKEDVAAIKVQTAFRRFLARRKLRALKGLVRLKVLVQSQSVKRQAITTLRCMQTLARVQSQVRARRIRVSEKNQALQRELMQKRERELGNMKSYGSEERPG
ncbi:putative IQ motif, EF-hand binding protein [Helianthus anomalus]